MATRRAMAAIPSSQHSTAGAAARRDGRGRLRQVGGRRAARAALGLPLIEGDSFHPPANIDKMRAGLPLDDDDRAGWLAAWARSWRPHRRARC